MWESSTEMLGMSPCCQSDCYTLPSFCIATYTVVASVFLVSAASCKGICKHQSKPQTVLGQSGTIVMPHVLIKYAHMLICICTGKGSHHFKCYTYFILLSEPYCYVYNHLAGCVFLYRDAPETK